MLAAYCVRRAGEPAPEPGLTGVGGEAVRLLETRTLGLWLSDVAGHGTDPDRLRQHDAVVRAALESTTPLPLRFGTVLQDDDAAVGLLAARCDEFIAGLDRVAGRVEMGIRVLWERATPAAAERQEVHSGTEFLEARRRELRVAEALRSEAEALLKAIDLCLAPLALPTVRTVLAQDDAAGTLAHLVHRSDLTRYLTDVDEARASLPRARLRLSGPWAPYSFV